MPSIYIINPRSTPGYYTSEVFTAGDAHFTQTADLAIVTVAAFVPAGWDIKLTDESIEPADLDIAADFIAITGKVSQRTRMYELADHYRTRGITVIIGGSFASLTPDDVAPHADILFTGELEDIGAAFFADLESGTWRAHYDGGQADITRSPRPRWDLYPIDRALSVGVQTARGCPFNCEFCDVIQYQGRKQRHKAVPQIINELDYLYELGARTVFLVDDNFTVHRRHAAAVLDALIAWNAQHEGDRARFLTQASIDVARDPELLVKCQRAGLTLLFVGIETSNAESLIETGKKQNLLMPTEEAVRIILSHGIAVLSGAIVGFDHDDLSTFDEQFDFFQALPLPDISLGVLNAPRATHLYKRLEREGRLIGEVWDNVAGSVFGTNIRPLLMSREELVAGAGALARRLYEPANFQQRLVTFIAQFGSDEERAPQPRSPQRGHGAVQVFFRTLHKISARGPAEAAMVSSVLRLANSKPQTLPIVMHFLARYEQARYVLGEVSPAAGDGEMSEERTYVSV